MRKKEHRVKELLLQTEEDHKTITMLNDAVEKLTEKVKVYKRQLAEQVRFGNNNNILSKHLVEVVNLVKLISTSQL